MESPTLRDCSLLQLDLIKFIQAWEAKWPFDRYIRKKYNILFGSPEHKALNFIDMAIEYSEERLLELAEQKSMRLDETNYETKLAHELPAKDENQPKQKVIKMTRKEVDEEFENIDLSQFNDK